MNRERQGGWVYIMANRYRGTIYLGVTAHLARRVFEHRQDTGSEFCAQHGLHKLVWAEHGATIEA